MNKDIFLTNSLGNKKAKFIPIDPKKIGMYVCGPTVYDNPHIGNARPLVVFDILFKVLKCKYGNNSVSYVRNITDIDDKIISSSVEKNIPRCVAINLKPKSDDNSLNLLQSLKKTYNHFDMGIYLKALEEGRINVGDKIQLSQ